MTVCTRDPIEDIGLGVTIERRYMDGSLRGIAYWHPDPKTGESCHGWVSVPDEEGWPKDSWTLVSEHPLTLSPSLLCRACGHHGFIQQGKWVAC